MRVQPGKLLQGMIEMGPPSRYGVFATLGFAVVISLPMNLLLGIRGG